MKITFKQYLESKKKLVEAIKRSPIQRQHYEITKYCKLAVLENVEDDIKITLLLKPKQELIIEWMYETIDNPKPVSIRVLDNKNPIISEKEFFTNWKNEKVKEWLSKNTIEKQQSL